MPSHLPGGFYTEDKLPLVEAGLGLFLNLKKYHMATWLNTLNIPVKSTVGVIYLFSSCNHLHVSIEITFFVCGDSRV
jgi:hypothetical protein